MVEVEGEANRKGQSCKSIVKIESSRLRGCIARRQQKKSNFRSDSYHGQSFLSEWRMSVK